MAELPTCPNFQRGTCEKNDVILLRESEDSITVGCKTCHNVHVVTMPVGRARARYENWIEEQKRLAAMERAVDSRTRYY